MGGSSPPQIANPGQVASQQFGYNTTAGEMGQAGSQVNQITPTGSLSYQRTGIGPNGIPTYTATQALSPQEQQLLSEQQGGMATAGAEGANMLGSAFGQYSTPPNLSAMAGGETQQLLGQETSYLDPYFSQQSSQLDNQLRNQGLSPGSKAYADQMNNMQQSQNQAITGFLAQAEPQAFQQATQQYELPAQMAGMLMGMNQPQGVNAPYTGQAPNYQSPNYEGAVSTAQQGQMATYQAQMAQQNAMMQALASGATGLGTFGLASMK